MASERISYTSVGAEDFEELAALRIAAMRESLERVGRFDATRARERLRGSFYPEATRFILCDETKVGFYTFRLVEDCFQLDHLYVDPAHQSRGIGSSVMRQLLATADGQERVIRVGALRESASNRFYQRHGFQAEREDEWDIYYVREPRSAPRSK